MLTLAGYALAILSLALMILSPPQRMSVLHGALPAAGEAHR
jgi:hypothetical protein